MGKFSFSKIKDEIHKWGVMGITCLPHQYWLKLIPAKERKPTLNAASLTQILQLVLMDCVVNSIKGCQELKELKNIHTLLAWLSQRLSDCCPCNIPQSQTHLKWVQITQFLQKALQVQSEHFLNSLSQKGKLCWRLDYRWPESLWPVRAFLRTRHPTASFKSERSALVLRKQTLPHGPSY